MQRVVFALIAAERSNMKNRHLSILCLVGMLCLSAEGAAGAEDILIDDETVTAADEMQYTEEGIVFEEPETENEQVALDARESDEESFILQTDDEEEVLPAIAAEPDVEENDSFPAPESGETLFCLDEDPSDHAQEGEIIDLSLSIVPVQLYASDISVYFGWPVPSSNYVSSLDHHANANGGPGALHGGMDIKAEKGEAVLAAAAGTVVRMSNACPHDNVGKEVHETCTEEYAADPWADYGNYVALQHEINGDSFITVYGHMEAGSIPLKVGDTVNKGEQIGRIGSSGGSSSYHLHFEIYQSKYTTGIMNIKDLRAQTFQYFQNNTQLLQEIGITFPVRCRTSSTYFGDWIDEYCVQVNNGYTFMEEIRTQATIHFDPNGGYFRDDPANQEDHYRTIMSGSMYGQMPAPVRPEYDLTGWFTTPDGTEQIKPEDIFTPGGNNNGAGNGITLYAHWKVHDGWRIKNNVYYYYDWEGNLVTDELRQIDGAVYYLDSYGRRVENKKKTVGRDDYYFGSDGKMAVSSLVSYNGDKYYSAGSGKLVKDKKQKIGGKYYYFNSYGKMVKNKLVTVGSYRYYFGSDGVMLAKSWKDIGGYRYRFNSAGKMQTGFQTIGSYSYYFSTSGKMVTNKLQKIGSSYYYFSKKGRMIRSAWKTVSGNRYYFGKDGKAYTGTKKIGGKKYTFTATGKLQK